MCEITESESMERRLDQLAAENARLLRDCRRVAAFVGSRAWDAMNERRAELIGRDTDGGLSDAERAELATLQLAVDVLIGVRHPLPGPDDGAWKDALIRSAQAEVARLKAERDRMRVACEATREFLDDAVAYGLARQEKGRVLKLIRVALDGVEAPTGETKPLVVSPEQYELGYAVAVGFPIQGGTPIRREPYRLIRRLPDGTYLIEDPTASGPAGEGESHGS